MQKKMYNPWMLSLRDVRNMSTWEYKKLMTQVIERPTRPSFGQMAWSFFMDSEDSFFARLTTICALAAWAVAAWAWAPGFPLSGHPEDAVVLALVATVVAVLVTTWSLSRYIAVWETEFPKPRHRRPNRF